MGMKSILLFISALVITALINTASDSGRAEPDIKAFVRVLYDHGVPYTDAIRFDKGVVPILIGMLNDPSERKWWDNIVVTLGYIGDEHAVDPLIDFLERDVKGELEPEVWSAMLSVHRALGNIAAQGSDKALNYLITSTTPETWQAKALPWKVQGLSGEKLHTPLIKSAIVGLGISAHPRAIQVLQQMQTSADIPEWRKQVASSALRLFGRIKAEGRVSVFSKHN
jgi:HEAT repeat protein